MSTLRSALKNYQKMDYAGSHELWSKPDGKDGAARLVL